MDHRGYPLCAQDAPANADACAICRIWTTACRNGDPTPRIPACARICARSMNWPAALIEAANRDGDKVIVVSEYGIVPVRGAVHINRALRRGRSRSLSHGDGSGGHRSRRLARFRACRSPIGPHLSAAWRRPGLGKVTCSKASTASPRCWTRPASAPGVSTHQRSGELVALARPDRWFSYYWWLEDAKAPDYARTVDIHRKPGYDPMELFLDPALPLAQAQNRAADPGAQARLPKLARRHSHSRHLPGQGFARPDQSGPGLDCPVVISNDTALLPAGCGIGDGLQIADAGPRFRGLIRWRP